VVQDLGELAARVARATAPGDHVVVMSNGGFGGMPQRILGELAGRSQTPAEAGGQG
jgi:UDP-N-acetylmuramate: L-alanyl-gamma-D-glutamyl-meso-diaminopimelate ligase